MSKKMTLCALVLFSSISKTFLGMRGREEKSLGKETFHVMVQKLKPGLSCHAPRLCQFPEKRKVAVLWAEAPATLSESIP